MSRKSFSRSGSQTLFFRGREATTGNASGLRRLCSRWLYTPHAELYNRGFLSILVNSMQQQRSIVPPRLAMFTFTPAKIQACVTRGS